MSRPRPTPRTSRPRQSRTAYDWGASINVSPLFIEMLQKAMMGPQGRIIEALSRPRNKGDTIKFRRPVPFESSFMRRVWFDGRKMNEAYLSRDEVLK